MRTGFEICSPELFVKYMALTKDIAKVLASENQKLIYKPLIY